MPVGHRGSSNKSIMKLFIRILLATVVFAGTPGAPSRAAETIRIAVQKTGTFAWELAVIRAHGLDSQANLAIEVSELASPEAGKIALRGGSADIIDNNWLLLRALMKQDGIDLKSESTIVYGAPPLLAAKILSGEMDATVNYWNFCAALEAKGLRRLVGIEDLLPKLGAKGRTAMIGYVFDEGWESANRSAVSRFVAMTRAAKEILATSDAEWEKIAPLSGATDAATLRAYRDRYREGIPRRPIADEEADARILYRVLAAIGGREIVGAAQELDPGTFYRAIPGD